MRIEYARFDLRETEQVSATCVEAQAESSSAARVIDNEDRYRKVILVLLKILTD
jgi:hypothetical protein